MIQMEYKKLLMVCVMIMVSFINCSDDPDPEPEPEPEPEEIEFVFGADLSYVNQILDHDGVYKVGGTVTSPYKIMKDNGTELARFRLWHNPTWTKELVYGDAGTQLY